MREKRPRIGGFPTNIGLEIARLTSWLPKGPVPTKRWQMNRNPVIEQSCSRIAKRFSCQRNKLMVKLTRDNCAQINIHDRDISIVNKRESGAFRPLEGITGFSPSEEIRSSDS